MSSQYPPRLPVLNPIPRLANDQDWNQMWDWLSGSSIIGTSYIIYSGSDNYKARNAQTGLIQFSGSNPRTVIQSTINIVASDGGGIIFIKSGTYNIDGSLTILDQNNITVKGVWNKSILKTTVAAGVALNVGDQNAVDSNYHAQNIVLEDLVFDGGYSSITNGAGLGITTAFNVSVRGCIFQNSGEVGTGGFRLTNWNATQALSKNIWIQNNYFKDQKISITGVINCWCTHNVFDGVAPTDTGRALVDFSKGDFTPLSANRITNTHFDDNAIYGWTQSGGGIQGLQAVQGCTISRNYWDGLKTLIGTVDATPPYDLNGLIIEDNEFWNCTGQINIAYGDRIKIRRNKWMTDAVPANFSTALTVYTGSNGANPVPTNIDIEDNLIYKWGGVGMVVAFSRGGIKRNTIIDCNQKNASPNSNASILINRALSRVDISENNIFSTVTAGSGSSKALNYNEAAQNCRFFDNRVQYAADPTSPYFFQVNLDPTFLMTNNVSE